jgi:hypothetical protein
MQLLTSNNLRDNSLTYEGGRHSRNDGSELVVLGIIEIKVADLKHPELP